MDAKSLLVGVLVVASLAGLAGAQGPSGPLPPQPGHVTVGWDDAASSVEYQRYLPATIVVHAGESVTWNAGSDAPHTVTSYPPGGDGSFDSSPDFSLSPQVAAAFFGPGGFLTTGMSFNATLTQPGTYLYFCKIHPGMTGTITVVNATSSTPQNPLGVGTGMAPNGTGNHTVYVTAGWGSGETSVDRFGPQNITIEAGTKVVWTNMHSAEPHTVSSFGPNGPVFDSSPNIQGEPPGFGTAHGVMQMHGNNTQFTHAFDSAGTWTYFCKLHPGMWGTVVVLPKESAAMPGNTSGGSSGSTTGSTTTSAGSRVPGFEAPLLVGALALVALAVRRR